MRSTPLKRSPFRRKKKQVDKISTGPGQHHGFNEVGHDGFGSSAGFDAIKEIAICGSTADLGPSQHQRKNSTENIQSKTAQSHAQQAPVAIISIVTKPARIAPFSTEFRGSIPKSQPVRSETYRRAVASLPCVICGVPGYSQAAHGSGAGTAVCKGMGLKSCDLTCFPACALRCHPALDQGALFTKAARHALEPAWAADTQRKIHAMGLWPKGLAYPHDQQQGVAR